jgi:glucan-binding YG repeat protein
MTSFAAAGWVEEDGTWYYYDKDGNKVEDEWKKSGSNWYWLDSEEGGAMAVDKLIDDGSNTYYVDSNGVMVTNTWVKIINEDQDDDDDPAEYNYYYFQANGKAYKDAWKKTIDGKKYSFDTDGKMLYGWVDKTSNARQTGDDGWKSADYYFGSWEDGAMATNWQYLTVTGGWDSDDDEDDEYWFYFGSNGAKRTGSLSGTKAVNDNTNVKSINGAKYTFTENGEMAYKWVVDSAHSTSSASATSASDWKYFGSADDGARKTKGWFKVVPKAFDPDFNGDESDIAQWYYSNGDGTVAQSEIKKIKNKYYAFDEYGAMLSGLVYMETSGSTITDVVAVQDTERNETRTLDLDGDFLDDLKDGNISATGTLYYFGTPDSADSDGSMKTGNVTLSIDGSSYSFNFSTAGGAESKGAGRSGLYKKVYYKAGMKMAADADDKYRAADVTVETDVTFLDSSVLRTGYSTVVYNSGKSNEETISYVDVYSQGYKLIGTNGQVKKNAKGVKDGDDWYYFSDSNGVIKYYASNKNLETALKQNGITVH